MGSKQDHIGGSKKGKRAVMRTLGEVDNIADQNRHAGNEAIGRFTDGQILDSQVGSLRIQNIDKKGIRLKAIEGTTVSTDIEGSIINICGGAYKIIRVSPPQLLRVKPYGRTTKQLYKKSFK